jgi:hypothetical protein
MRHFCTFVFIACAAATPLQSDAQNTEPLAPHSTAVCAGLLANPELSGFTSNQTLYAIRGFEQRLQSELKRVKARRRGLNDYLFYENRQGAVIVPNIEDVYLPHQQRPSAKYELTLGHAIGRLQALEADMARLQAGVFAFGRMAQGADKIQNLWSQFDASVDSANQELERVAKQAIPYLNAQRQDLISKSFIGSLMAGAFFGLAAVSTIHDPTHLSLAAANFLWPVFFKGNIAQSVLYMRSPFSPNARIHEENQWYYRARHFNALSGAINTSHTFQPRPHFIYLGLGAPLTEKLGRTVNGEKTDSSLSTEMLQSLQALRLGFDPVENPDNIGFGAIDVFYFFDDESHQPTLVIAGRMRRLVVPPDKPKTEKQSEKSPIFDWEPIGSGASARSGD